MSLTQTTLASAATAADLTLKLTSTTGFAAGQIVKIEDEYMVCSSVPQSGYINVYKRGDQGTAVVAHSALAYVVTSTNPADFPAIAPGTVNAAPAFKPDLIGYSVSGAIALPTSVKDRIVYLDKAGAAVMTLADPPKSLDGVRMQITSSTAQAHTVTNTTGFNGGGTASDVATFGGAIGDNFEIEALNGVWNVNYAKNVTLA